MPPTVTLLAIFVPQPSALGYQLVKIMTSSWLPVDQRSAVQFHQSPPAAGADEVLYVKPAFAICDRGVRGLTEVFGYDLMPPPDWVESTYHVFMLLTCRHCELLPWL